MRWMPTKRRETHMFKNRFEALVCLVALIVVCLCVVQCCSFAVGENGFGIWDKALLLH